MPDPGVGVTGAASASPGAACDGTAEGLVAATVVAVVIRGGATGDAFFAGMAANATGLGRSTALGDSRLLALASSTFTSGRAGSRTSTLSAGRNAEVGGGTTTPNASQRAKKCTPADNSRNRPIRQNDCRYALGKALTPHAVALKSVSESTAMSPKREPFYAARRASRCGILSHVTRWPARWRQHPTACSRCSSTAWAVTVSRN